MNKKEAAHLSEILKAWSEGKTIEGFHVIYKKWVEMEKDNCIFDPMGVYRIKPEPKLRPYKNAEEFLQAQKEHGPNLYPHESDKDLCLPIMFPSNTNSFWYLWRDSSDNEIKWQNACFHLLTGKWQDGTPCGITEE